MGYEIHITRQRNWFENNGAFEISISEWLTFLAEDSEMRLDNFAEATTSDGEIIRLESEGLAVWTKYSGDGINGNHAWFSYINGNIIVKNPDDEIIYKMLKISFILKANVQGDNGEFYQLLNENVFIRHVDKKEGEQWWKFW